MIQHQQHYPQPQPQKQYPTNIISKDADSFVVTSDGTTTMYPKFSYPQPVPFSALPASAGNLPSWEEKKLQLDMMHLNTDESAGYISPPPVRPYTGDPSSANASSSSLGAASRLPARPHTAGGGSERSHYGSTSSFSRPRDNGSGVSSNVRPQTAGSGSSAGYGRGSNGSTAARSGSSTRPNTSGGERSSFSTTAPRPHTSSGRSSNAGTPWTSPAHSPSSQRSDARDYSFPRPHTSSGGIGGSPSFNDGRLGKKQSHGNFFTRAAGKGSSDEQPFQGAPSAASTTGIFSNLRNASASSPNVHRQGLQGSASSGPVGGGLPSSVQGNFSHNSRTAPGPTGAGQAGLFEHGGAAYQQEKPKKKGNPLLRFLQKRFSSKYRREQELQRQQYQQQRGVGYSMPGTTYDAKQYGVSQSHNKTRSIGFTEKMRRTSGKAAERINDAGRRWFKINSKTPKEDLPRTWDEWKLAYSRGMIDPNDIPEPPPSDPIPDGVDPASVATPYQAQFLPGPYPDDQKARQIAFNRLDWRGKRGPKPSTIPVPEGEEPLPDTLEEHPAFRKIVAQAREAFDSAISIITVFNEDKQLFLAETGVNGAISEMPREVSFCSHACLTKPLAPFTIQDTHRDWRFVNNPMVTQFGCRSYYGVPLLAPDFSGQDSQIPIGTLCVIDMKPRESFTAEEKAKMGDLALLAQKTIANWSRARLNHRINLMEKSFQSWKSDNMLTLSGLQANGVQQAVLRAAASGVANRRIGNAAGGPHPSSTLPNRSNTSLSEGSDGPTVSTDSLPANASRQAEVAGVKRERADNTRTRSRANTANSRTKPSDKVLVISSDVAASSDGSVRGDASKNGAASFRSSPATSPLASPRSEAPTQPLPAINDPDMPLAGSNGSDRGSPTEVMSTNSAYHTAPAHPSNKQKIFDISTRLVANSLELDLVYILKLDLSRRQSTRQSGGGEEDGGEGEAVDVTGMSLLSSYGLSDPSPAFDSVLHLKALQSEEGGLLYQNPDMDELVTGERLTKTEDVEYASALLVPIAESESTGYVLAGFTSDPEHVFERDDLLYMTTLASELSIYLQG